MLIDELIEKAFSDGYEYALEEQREFTKLRQLKKQAKMNANFLSKVQKKFPIWASERTMNKFAKNNGFGSYVFRSERMEHAGQRLVRNNPQATEKMKKSIGNYVQKKGIDLSRF